MVGIALRYADLREHAQDSARFSVYAVHATNHALNIRSVEKHVPVEATK